MEFGLHPDCVEWLTIGELLAYKQTFDEIQKARADQAAKHKKR